MPRQLDRLRALLRAIVPGNRFYAPRLAAAGVTAEIASLEAFSARLPFTRKDELVRDQAAHPPYGSNLTFPIERYTRFCQTSGTTTRALVILDTAESWDWMLGNWAHIYRAAGVAPGDRFYFAFSFGPFLGFWTAFEAAARLGFLCIPGGGLRTSGRLRALIEHRATVLCCTPTYALHLAEVGQEEGIDLRSAAVRKIIVAGEPGGSIPEVRARIAAAWPGTVVIDHYGMTEVGPVALQDPACAGVLRVIEDSYFAEVVDPQTGAAVPAGQVGELVLTTLGRTACPLLRYRTGDLVKRIPDAPGFALEGGIIGRADDMVVVRGVNLYPSAVDAVVQSVSGIAEYRVEISRRGALAEVAIAVECEQAATTGELEAALTSAFSLRIPVRQVAAGELPRFEMKARRWAHAEAP
ncbi:MAG: phenylacetate-CoA ligase [Chthoniobacter sp.]|jgi:phenylacetate-CoA ligase|nr:phenylacetate-CoA ligase [Chthoniobacter sp.]